MATVLSKIVDPDNAGGTNYTSRNAWEAAYGGVAGNGDCVGQDKIAKAVVRCTGGTADSTAVQFNGWASTDSTRYIWVYIDPAYRHNGKYATGNVARFANTSTTWGYRVNNNNVVIEGELSAPGYNAQYNAAFYSDAGVTGVYFLDCVAYGGLLGTGNNYGYQISSDSGKTKYCRNCLAYDFASSGRGWTVGTTAGAVVLHCCAAVDNNGMGFRTVSSNVNTANNCVSFGNGDDWNGTWLGSYNGYKEGSAPTSNDIDLSGYTGAQVFSGYSTDNFRPKAGGPLENAGQNLYANGTLPVTTDMWGHPRPSSGNFDLGLGELMYADGGGTLPALTGNGAAVRAVYAEGGGTLPALTGDGTATKSSTIMGEGGGTLPALTGSGTAVHALYGSGGGTLPTLTGDGAATRSVYGSGGGTLPALVGAGTCVHRVYASGSGTLPSLSGSGTAVRAVHAEGSGTLPALTGAGTGLRAVRASGSGTLPALTGDGLGTRTVLASGSGTLPALQGA